MDNLTIAISNLSLRLTALQLGVSEQDFINSLYDDCCKVVNKAQHNRIKGDNMASRWNTSYGSSTRTVHIGDITFKLKAHIHIDRNTHKLKSAQVTIKRKDDKEVSISGEQVLNSIVEKSILTG